MSSRILIVDDEHTNLASTRLYLGARNPNYIIFIASSLEDALNLISYQHINNEPIDVLLTDLIMKTATDGIELIGKAKIVDPDLVCILFTANAKSVDRSQAYGTGAFEVIEKTTFGKFSQEEIAIKIEKALEIKEKYKTYSFLRKYFDPEIVGMIEKDRASVQLKQKTVTIVFWDIRGFSKLCETLKESPVSISKFLDEFTILASKVINSNGGILDKFMGDGVMAIFGYLALLDNDVDNAAAEAVVAAIQFRQEFIKLCERWKNSWQRVTPEIIDIKLGCGIHTGSTLVGEIGSNTRAQFTAIGPHVNFAARIEGKAKNGEILISQSTKVRLSDKYKIEAFSIEGQIKNIAGSFQLYSINL